MTASFVTRGYGVINSNTCSTIAASALIPGKPMVKACSAAD